MKKDLRNIVIGALLGLLAAWLLGMFNSASTTAAEPAEKAVEATSKPGVGIPVVKNVRSPEVELPTVAPIKISRAATPEAARAEAAAEAEQMQYEARVKTIKNNLRMISQAAQNYLMYTGRSECSYTDLVGTTTDNLIRNVAPVAGEDYSVFYSIRQNTTELSIITSDGTTVTFDQ